MNATRHLLQQQRQPMIKFLGKRNTPSNLDHSPHAHPASPLSALPSSFAEYRQKAQQHGPLVNRFANTGYGAIGSHSGASLGPVEPGKGQVFDRNELPDRFRRLSWTKSEIDAIESGGASLYA